MDYVHRCPFCAWHRAASAAAMVEPHCPECGGLLEALSCEAYARERDRAARERARRMPRIVTPRARRWLTIGRWTATAVIAIAVGRAALDWGGVALAAGAFALAALFSLNVLFPTRR